MSSELLVWYASIFFGLFLTGIGLPPVPEEAGILYAAGLCAVHEEVRWWLAWPLAGLGIIAADCVLYGAGRLWGERLLAHRWVQKVIKPDRRKGIEGRFERHGIKILLMARLLPPLRTGVFIIAGAIRYPFAYFLLADLAYAVVGVGIFFFGGTWLIEQIRGTGNLAIYIVAALAGVYGLYRYYRYLRKREQAGAPVPASVLDLPEPAPTTAPAEPTAAGSAPDRL